MAPGLEVGEVFRRHGEAYRRTHGVRLGRVERRVMAAITACRTPPSVAISSSVRTAGCCASPTTPAATAIAPSARARPGKSGWQPVRSSSCQSPYFHVVFTLPAALAEIALHNKVVIYAILFRAATETLCTIAADRRHLGAEIGILAVLHTWGRNLHHHPHVHCVVPGGGLSPDGRRWVSCRHGFFLPVPVLSRRFRRVFLEQLQAAFAAGSLHFSGALAKLAEPAAFRRCLAAARRQDWVVYAKPPFGGPEQVLTYLCRYTHRVAIANSRLVSITEDHVSFRWRDWRHPARRQVMRLSAGEFIRRFLLHTLPDGFHRIRYYGFFANRQRAAKLALCRQLLAQPAPPEPADKDHHPRPRTAPPVHLCPECGGHMQAIAVFPWPFPFDTS